MYFIHVVCSQINKVSIPGLKRVLFLCVQKSKKEKFKSIYRINVHKKARNCINYCIRSAHHAQKGHLVAKRLTSWKSSREKPSVDNLFCIELSIELHPLILEFLIEPEIR